MRSIKLISIILLVGLNISATLISERETVYLNERMEVIQNKKNATYTGKLEEINENGHLFRIYFITGEVKMEGYYADAAMNVAHGLFTYYYRNGKIESSGHFRNGMKYGLWQRFNSDGSEKAEKIYAVQPMLEAMKNDSL